MRNEVSWQVELTVKPNQLKNFRALTKEMVEFTKSEVGVLVYERYVSENGMTVFVYERCGLGIRLGRICTSAV